MMRHYNNPDPTAPKHKPTRYGLFEDGFQRRFIKKFPKYKGMSKRELSTIINTFDVNIREHVVHNRDGAQFPEGLGYCFIGSCHAMKNENPNKTLSLQHNKTIQHQNFESDSYVAKIFYTNFANKYKFKLRELWTFKGSRAFTRTTSEEYRKSWKKYVVVDSFTHIRQLFERIRKKDLAIRLGARDIIGYNEFQLD